MVFGGIQKLTLLDFPGKVACTVFTAGCNLRCPFCHNALLTDRSGSPTVPEDEILAFLKKRAGILDGVCITGGEPLIYSDIPDFIKKIRALGYKVKLDTNGTFPDRLKSLIDEKLIDFVAMDIKNSPQKYGETAGVNNFDITPVKKSIEILKSSDTDFEFRTTCVKGLHQNEDFDAIGNLIAGDEKYFLQNFTDSGDILCPGRFSGFSKDEMLRFLMTVRKYVPHTELRGID